jgi:cobalt-zinc-cadmium efflux system outer membrane protein
MDEAIAKALAERPDLKAARAEEERANAEFRLARAERVPDVIGVARYGRVESQFPQFGTTSTGQLAPLRDTDHVLTLGVSIPLPFANRNQGNIETSTARRQAASLRRQFLEQSVRTEVIAAYTQYVAASQALEAFGQDVVKQSQETITTSVRSNCWTCCRSSGGCSRRKKRIRRFSRSTTSRVLRWKQP